MTGSISAEGSSVECGAAGSGAFVCAFGGLVVQVQPDPLGVRAIGENEYVWSGTTPAELEINAAAKVHTWGWDGPDTAWLASEVCFSTDPEIPTDYTKPGIQTVARGSLLVAQSLVDENLQDGLVYRSKYLPPKNSDFGKKKVLFESKQGKVDYADVEVFYPAEAANHPPGGQGCRGRFEYDLRSGLIACEFDAPAVVLNWFYYYVQAYPAAQNPDVWYAVGTVRTQEMSALTCHGYAQRPDGTRYRKSIVYIFDTPTNYVSPCSGPLPVPLFRCVNGRPTFLPNRWMYVRGIHKFIGVLEHELVHKQMYENNQLYPEGAADADGDGVLGEWEQQNGFDSRTAYTTGYPIPDAEAVAYIIQYGKLLAAWGYWERDWASCPTTDCERQGLQRGVPCSPFPWFFGDMNGQNRSADPPSNLANSLPACLEP